MNEERQATLLARWLEEPGTEPPPELDPVVAAAVFSLRPRQAPPPRVSLDDIFAEVTTGPFALSDSERIDSDRIDSDRIDRDGVEREGVEREGVEGRAGARVEGALAGGVNAGDSLPNDSLANGPLPNEVSSNGTFPGKEAARAAGAARIGGGEARRVGNVVGAGRVPPQREVRRRAAWTLPAVGTALAAAVVGLLVIPSPFSMRSEPAGVATMAAPSTPVASQAPMGIPEMDGAPPPSGAVAMEAPLAEPMPGDASTPAAMAPPPPPEAMARAAAPKADASPPATVAPTTVPVAPAAAPQPMAAASPLASTSTISSGAPASAGRSMSPAPAKSAGEAPIPMLGEEPGVVAYDEDGIEVPASEWENSGGMLGGVASGSSVEGNTAGDDAAVVADAAEPAITEAAKQESAGKTKAGPRPKAGQNGAAVTGSYRSVTPWDYNQEWYKAWPDVYSTYQLAQAQAREGERAAAVATYKTLLGDTRTNVAQDAAYQAARLEQAMGNTPEALRTVETGLRRSSQNTPFRAQLLSFKADLLTLSGRGVEAEGVRAEAARLNLERQPQ